MGLINSFNDWVNARYEKRISKMEEKGLCPDCHGRGFNTYANEYVYGAQIFDCPSCEGTGSFNAWYERNN